MPLIEDTLFGRIDKVQIAITRLKTFEPPEGFYLAFSGGKDSQCIYHLAQMAGVKFDAHYNLTTIDPPELVHFIRKYYPNVQRHRPKLTMWQLIRKKHSTPTRQLRWCCALLKEIGGEDRFVITGVRWQESARRAKRQMIDRCMKSGSSKKYIHPIIDWTVSDVWEFLKDRPHCSLYDEGFKRIGCIMCPYSNIKRDYERWPKVGQAWKRAIERAFRYDSENRLHLFKTSADYFQWYLSGKNKRNPDQTVMFE